MSFHDSILRVMSGEARGVGAGLSRGFLCLVEPIYRGVVAWRNRRFDHNPSRIRRLPRPVISIGNLTTGGTGKTPIVRHLAAALRDRGRKVAILSRGYKATPGTLGDEQRMLQELLGPGVVIEADPDRHAAGLRVLARAPEVELFLLDDGFQHRRLHRDLDIVLLHASEPFGYGHTLPRGLLREPPASLRRAGAVILTNVDRADTRRLEETVVQIRRWNPDCPILREHHQPAEFRSIGQTAAESGVYPLTELQSRRAFCFSGLGSPAGFENSVRTLAGQYLGQHRFPDHHAYTPADLQMLRAKATSAGADVLVTTEKDWVKIAPLPQPADNHPPIWRLDIQAQFPANEAAELLQRVEKVL